MGATVNEERSFTVDYRPDYPEKRLAGKTVEYKVKVEGIKTKEIPELNDEFAQRFGEYKTLDELKAKIREDLEKHKREHAQEQMREKLLEWLEDNNEFEVPESLVERQLQIRVQRLLRDLSRQGINPQRLDVDWAKIREDQQSASHPRREGFVDSGLHFRKRKYRDHGRRDRGGNRKDRRRDESAERKGAGGTFAGFGTGSAQRTKSAIKRHSICYKKRPAFKPIEAP